MKVGEVRVIDLFDPLCWEVISLGRHLVEAAGQLPHMTGSRSQRIPYSGIELQYSKLPSEKRHSFISDIDD
jgi:hypothetical protein